MKKYIITNLECIGLQIIFAVLSLFLYSGFIPDVIYSIFTAWLFLWAIHSTFWQMGNRERKRIKILNNHLEENQKPYKLNRLKGALIALPFLLVNLLILFFTYITNDNYLLTAQTVAQFAFMGFLTSPGETLDMSYIIPRICVCLVMYIPCVTAYISGTYNYSFIDKYFPKLIYKNSDKDKKDTKSKEEIL